MNGHASSSACDMVVKVVSDLARVGEILEEVETEKEKLVLDMRSLPEEEMQVKLLVEGLTCRVQRVAQLWLPNLPKKFKELMSRLQKRQETKGLVGGVVMAEASLKQEECFALARKVANMYKVFSDDLADVVAAHPVFEHHAPGAMVIIETRASKPRVQPGVDGEEVESVESAIEPDRKEIKRRRPHEKTFRKVRKFLREAEENGETGDLNSKGGGPADDKCFLCLKSEAHVLRRGLCKDCTELNQKMIEVKADLRGKFAIVTGGRIKIGLRIALRLLRDGCFVIVTTRFAVNGWKVFSEQPDFGSWSQNLRILPLDLQDLNAINAFLESVNAMVPHVDILINNAAQTLSRPAAFYKYLHVEATAVLEGPDAERIKEVCTTLDVSKVVEAGKSLELQRPDSTSFARCQSKAGSEVLSEVDEAEESDLAEPPVKLARSEGEVCRASEQRFFPLGRLDEEGQQVDLRHANSWTLGLQEVPLSELLQTLTVNSVAPFLLISRLTPLLQRSPSPRKFIVNVSAMEGQFGRVSKGCKHPHTNMAKAALNMLTRTSGLELQLDRIYMTAVDTGWCTDERPHATHYGEERHQECVKGFQVPLSHEDGAARVYHPVWHGLQENCQPYFATFLKNFKPHPW